MRSFTIIGGNMLNQIIKIALYSVVLSVFLSTGFTKNHNNNDNLQRTSIFIGKYVGQPRGYWHDSAFNLYLSYQFDKNILSYMPNIILGRYRYDGNLNDRSDFHWNGSQWIFNLNSTETYTFTYALLEARKSTNKTERLTYAFGIGAGLYDIFSEEKVFDGDIYQFPQNDIDTKINSQPVNDKSGISIAVSLSARYRFHKYYCFEYRGLYIQKP